MSLHFEPPEQPNTNQNCPKPYFVCSCRWIKETEGSNLIVAQADDPNYMRSMERALRMGDPVALTKVTEELDPSLRPILLRETFTRLGHEIITLGETEIEYNQNFRYDFHISSASNVIPAMDIFSLDTSPDRKGLGRNP